MEKRAWEKLWLDLLQIFNNNDENVHYMGSIVLQASDTDKTFYVIDGQQRLVTISIIILACLKIIEKFSTDEDKERITLIRDIYLGNKDGVSLSYSSKLTLNSQNDDFYKSYLNQLREPINVSKLNDSDRLMYEAFQYFYAEIKNESFAVSSVDIYKFIDNIIGDKLFFIQISVDDEMSAYTVFETLNDRGTELTTSDLLKNYIFSLIQNKIDIDEIDRQWNELTSSIGMKKMPQFIRYYINSTSKLIRSERLFKEIRATISNDKEAFQLLNNLNRSADLYIALDEPENELWIGSKDIQKVIEELSLFNAEQHKSLMMSAYFNLDKAEFLKVLRIVRTIVFRYTIIASFNTNELEKQYNNAAVKISNKVITTASEVFKELRSIYVNDEDFKALFATKPFDTRNTKQKKIVKYILSSIENQLFKKEYNVMDANATVEHILPEHAGVEWENEFTDNIDSAKYRLGNLTLLEEKKNRRDAADKLFYEKREIYSDSQYEKTKKLSYKESWTMNEIRGRQNELANIAATIWKADY